MSTFLLIDSDGNKFGSISAGSATVRGPGDITGRLHDETAFALSYECAMELYRQLGNAICYARGPLKKSANEAAA
jgi:hypothetical protein